MKAVEFDTCGPADVLKFVENRVQPRPGPGEIMVRVRAAGANPRDFKVRNSNLMRLSFGIRLPAVCGNDIAGEVAELGPGVSEFAVGDAVLAMLELKRPGAYAEYAVASAEFAAKKPAVLSFEEAAGLPLAGLTALQLLRETKQLSEGKHILINGASGGVGSFATQLAKANSVSVTAVTSAKNAAYVRALGADHVIDYASEDISARGPYDAVIDTIGNVSYWRAKKALRPGGVYASCDPAFGVLVACGASAFSRNPARLVIVKPSREALAELVRLVELGALRTHIEQVFELRNAISAHRHLETSRTRGKIVLRID